jgi:hypothetical protein
MCKNGKSFPYRSSLAKESEPRTSSIGHPFMGSLLSSMGQASLDLNSILPMSQYCSKTQMGSIYGFGTSNPVHGLPKGRRRPSSRERCFATLAEGIKSL